MTTTSADVTARIHALPLWRGAVEPEPLSGGLSNQSFTVRDGGETFVVRLGQDLPFHHVFREREIQATRAAHAAGFAPELVYAEPGVMVSRFIHGTTFDADLVRANIPRIAALAKAFHRTMPEQMHGPAFAFWPFHVIRDYARTLHGTDSPWATRLGEFTALSRELEALQQPMSICFGHHDLLPANFIDDGDRLWLIDFEYAGFGTPMFDLAGIAANAGFSDGEALDLLTRYTGAAPDTALIASHSAMQCASLLREAMWSMISHGHMNTPGIDYVAYAQENLGALEAALRRHDQRFGTHLHRPEP